MTYSILWTLLPAGLDAARGVAKLTLVASPRLLTPGKTLASSPLHQWPVIAGALKDIRLRDALAQSKTPPLPTQITSQAPSLDLWQATFPAQAPAAPYDQSDAPVLVALESAYSVAENARAVDALYADVLRTAASERLTRGHPATARIAALAGGGADAALAGDLAAVAQTARRLRGRSQARAKAAASAVAPASPTAAIRSVEQADVHQVIGMLMDHPALARKLGLLIDLEIPLFRGERILRAVDAAGAPLNGPVAVPQPWSHVVCDPDRGLFVMKTQPDAPADATEAMDGMLDLRADGVAGKYALTDMDVLSSALQLNALAERLAASATLEPGSLPGRRNAGLTLAQRARATSTLQHNVKRSARFDGGAGEIDGAPVLYADDVTAGYRVDVSRDGGPFRSLMQRVVNYRVVGTKQLLLTVSDEGKVEAGSAVEEIGEDGQARLVVGEELFAFKDWSLVAPRPGPVVAGDGPDAGAEFVGPGALPGFPLQIEVQAAPGTLPRLRFGSSYQVRVRLVDLAGQSIDAAACNPALVSPKLVYRRLDRVGAPQLVPRKAYRRGESHLRLVVLSDGDGNPIGPACERHVLPPATAHDVAQQHGAFDAALGPDSPARQAARDALLRIGLRQDAGLNDPVVIGPGGSVVSATGITVARLDPASEEALAVLPLPRGSSLLPGQYVHHDTEQMLVPYLSDPAVAGAAFRGLPPMASTAPKAPIVVPYGNTPWPDPKPFLLVVNAGATAVTAVTKGGNGRAALSVTLAPATEITAMLSSALTPTAIKQMDPEGIANSTQGQQGEVHLFSQPLELTMVHAVQKPLTPPTLTLPTIERTNTGNTAVRLAGSVGAHRASTSRVDIEASWTEIVDDGQGRVDFVPRSAVVGSAGFGEAGDSRPIDLKQSFGDTKRRKVTYRAVATTRFTDCFTPPVPGQERQLQREGQAQVVDILSTQRPPPPDVHSCIPIFRWQRNVVGGVYTSVRRTAGVRVYLRPTWFASGEGELLGVLLHTSSSTAQSMQASSDAELFTRWGHDPYRTNSNQTLPPMAPSVVTNAEALMAFSDLPGASTNNTAEVYTVAGVPVAFDAARGLWFGDIELDDLTALFGVQWPFLRLGLVRLQPGTVPAPVGKTPRHVSGVVVTDFVQLPPVRTLTARRVMPQAVAVELSAIDNKPPVACSARWQRRTIEPLASPAPDVVTDGFSFPMPPKTTGSSTRANTVQEKPETVSAELFRAGRIVVEEALMGFSVTQEEGSTSSVLYREILECSVFDRADGPVT